MNSWRALAALLVAYGLAFLFIDDTFDATHISQNRTEIAETFNLLEVVLGLAILVVIGGSYILAIHRKNWRGVEQASTWIFAAFLAVSSTFLLLWAYYIISFKY